jgi:hypothetical protein
MLIFLIRHPWWRRLFLLPKLMLYVSCAGILLTQTFSCASPFNSPPKRQVAFELSNIFTTCHNPTNSTGIIPYKVELILYLYLNNNVNDALSMYEDVTANSASTPSSSIVLQALVPEDGTPYAFEIIITGTECARCALTKYGQTTCLQTPDGLQAYHAGVPRWRHFYGPNSGARTWFINNWTSIDNASCGCIVLNN